MREDPTPKPFAAKWEYPIFKHIDGVTPEVKKGRASQYDVVDALDILGDQALTKSKWQAQLSEERGISRPTAYRLMQDAEKQGKVFKNTDGKWELSASQYNV